MARSSANTKSQKRAWSLPRRRTQVLVATFILASVLISSRLVMISLAPSANYQGFAQTESTVSIPIPAYRGVISDAEGTPLAVSVPMKSVVADPLMVTDPVAEAQLLATDLGQKAPPLRLDLLQPSQFVYVARLIPASTANEIGVQVKEGLLPGISMITEPSRVYPSAPLLSPVLGATNSFGQGESGLEYQYNSLLSGRSGTKVERVSVSGLPLPGGTVSDVPAVNGDNVQLTIDGSLQYVAEQALASQIAATKAISGVIIVMDVKTGDILAMANVSAPPLPGIASSPNKVVTVGSLRSLPAESHSNLAVQSVYEPGSVVKLAVFTAALEHKVITPNSVLTVPDHMMIDGTLFHDAENHPTEQLSVGQILGQSSNIGTIEIAKKLGKVAINSSLLRFGWGTPTGLAFPGESQGFLDPLSRWSGTAIGSVPIGQDEALTPLQVLDAYNSIANGGVMVAPKLVKSVTAPDGRSVALHVPAPRRIVSSKVSRTVASLLRNAITANGTAPSASIPGYAIAGKTGTSQKPLPNQPGYQPGAFWGTFVGFAPAQHPVLSALVMLNQPVEMYGGVVAAPVFSHVMSYALAKYGITPQGTITKPTLGALVAQTPTPAQGQIGQPVVAFPGILKSIAPPKSGTVISGGRPKSVATAPQHARGSAPKTTLSWGGSPWMRGRIGG